MSDRNRRIHCFVDVEIGGNSAGRIVLELFSDVCPRTCSNFVKLCNGEKVDGELVGYKGKPFSALDSAVKVECTCSSDAVRDELRNRTYPDEVSVLKHFKELLLTTANRGSEANGLQWMITTASTPELNSTHLVFGRVVSGQGVVEQVHAATKDDHSRGTFRARIGNCGELKPRSLDQRKPPAIYQTLTDFYKSRETSDESQEDNWTKAVNLASLFKRNNKLSRVVASTSGDRKIKGRGTVRYRGSSSRSQSESDGTPPHWRTELEKVKPLGKDMKEVAEDRWIKGDKLVYVESVNRKSARYSRTESDDEDTGVHRRRSGRYSWEYDDSGQESSSRRSRKKSTRHSRRHEGDEEDSRSYHEMPEKYYMRQSESESDEDRKSKKRSRKRSRSVEYDSSDHDPRSSIKKKSKKRYSRKGDFESDEEMPRGSRKFKHPQSSESQMEGDSPPTRSKKKGESHRDQPKSDEESPRRSIRTSKKYSHGVKYKVKEDSSDQYLSGSESSDSGTEESEDTDEKQRSRPFDKKGFSKRKTLQKKERKKHCKHSKKSRDLSQEPSSESESEHSRTITLNSCDLKPGKSESLNLKAPRLKSIDKQDFFHLKMKARKGDIESENTKVFDTKIDRKNLSVGHFGDAVKQYKKTSAFPERDKKNLPLEHFGDAVKQYKKTSAFPERDKKNLPLEHFGDAVKQYKKMSAFPESRPSGYFYKAELKSSDEELKTVRKSRKEGRLSKSEIVKLQTIGEKVKQKLEDSPKKLNSRTSREQNATNQVTPKMFTSRGDRIEIIIPSSEEDEENAIVQPPLKKKLKLSLSDFDGGVAHASGSTGKKGNMSALKDFYDTEKRSRIDIKKSGEKMEEFRLNSRSSKGSGSNNGSCLRFESTDGSGETPDSKSFSDSRQAEMMSGSKKSERVLEIPKSGSGMTGSTKIGSRILSSDEEKTQSLLTVENKTTQGNKLSAKTHSFGSNYSLELSKKYSQIKTLRLRNKSKELEPYFYAQSPVQQSMNSSSRLDDRGLADQPDIVSKKQSQRLSDRKLSSIRHLSSSPERQIRQGKLSNKSRSRSGTSSRSYKSPEKHGRWSLSPEAPRKRMCSYSSSSRSYSSRSESYKSLRTGRRRVTVSSSSGRSRSRTRSSSRSRSGSRSSIKSMSRERQQTASSRHLVKQKESPALASVASVALPSGNSLSVAVKNLSESPPPSRWKPGQKPWKPKNILPAAKSVAESEKMQSASSALSAQRSDSIQKSQSQKSSKVGRSSLTDGQRRTGHEKSRGLRVRGLRRNSYNSEGSSQNSSSSRSVSRGRSSNRTDSDRSQIRSMSRSDRSKSDRSGNERSKSRSDRSKSRSDRSKSDRSKSRSRLSLYKSKVKNSKNIGMVSYSRTDSSSSGSQTSRTGNSRSRSTSKRSSRNKDTGSRSSIIARGISRSNSRSNSRSSSGSRSNQSDKNDNEKHHIVKKSSALNARSSRERSQPRDSVLVTSRGDSDAYDKRAVVKDDKLKSVKKEKVEEKKKVSQVQWEPPVEPEYILVDTEDEGSELDDPNRVSICKNWKWSKKGSDVTEADHDKTSEDLLKTSDEKDGMSAEKERTNKECTSENVAMEKTIPEVQEEKSGKPKDGSFLELCEVAVTSDSRLDLSGTLEKVCFQTEMDIIEVNTMSQSVNCEPENQVLVAEPENQVADVKAENQVSEVEVENQIAVVKAANEVADVKIKNEVINVNAENQITNINSQNETADVKGENLVADVQAKNQMMLDVKAETQMISDANIEAQADKSLLLCSEDKDDDSRKSPDLRCIDNMLGEVAASHSSVMETENKTSEAVNAEGLTEQTASESCSAIIGSAAENKEIPEGGSTVAMLSASVVESAPKSQMTFRQHQSRSGPSQLPRSNLQDNRLLGKQLNFTWKSRSRLPVSGSAGAVGLDSPESPRAPVLSSTSPYKLGHPSNVVDETPVLVENSLGEEDEKRQVFSKQSTKEGSEMVRQSRLKSNKSVQSPSAKRYASSDDSSSRSSSHSSRVSISSNSSAHLERSPSARSVSGRRYSNSPSQSSRSGSEGSRHWSQASVSRSPSFVSERRGRTVRTRSKSRTRRETRSRTRSRSRRRTRSRTRSISRRIRHRSRSRRSSIRRSYSKRSSRSLRRRSSRSLTRRRLRSPSRSRSRTRSRTPRSRLGRSRTRSRSRRSRTVSRRRSYSRRLSSDSEYDSRSRSASRSRSYRRRRESSSQDSYRQRRSSPSSRSRSRSSD